jgi:5-methylcytosine-specific restriction endonuclease McrA
VTPGVARVRKIIRFCSKACEGVSRRVPETKVETVCAHCGKAIVKRRIHLRERNYCSRECQYAARRVPLQKWHDPEYARPRMRIFQHNRRAKARANGGAFTHEEWLAVCEKHGNKCLRCGTTEGMLTPDHVVPISKGGTSDISNIQPLCLRCNKVKGAKTVDYR